VKAPLLLIKIQIVEVLSKKKKPTEEAVCLTVTPNTLSTGISFCYFLQNKILSMNDANNPLRFSSGNLGISRFGIVSILVYTSRTQYTSRREIMKSVPINI